MKKYFNMIRYSRHMKRNIFLLFIILGMTFSVKAQQKNIEDSPFKFNTFVIDDELIGGSWAQTSLFDINGDGHLDVITMSDQTNLRWYQIPDDPTEPWIRHDIGEAVHGGIAPMGFGDINGNGYTDVVRANAWFENVKGDGKEWRKHELGTVKTLLPGALEGLPDWANGTRTWVVDVNGNGRNDVVQCDSEVRGGSMWWMENLGETANGTVEWRRHIIAGRDRVMGGMHSLFVGDFNGNGRPDVVTAEMDMDFARPGSKGENKPRYFLWENLGEAYDGILSWKEHVIADVNLGGHEIVAGDVTGNGKLDIIGKPWRTSPKNALGGRGYVLFLHNVSP